MATREQLLAWGIRKRKTVDIGDGHSFLIEQLNAEVLDKINTAPDKNKNALCFVLSAINDDGTRIFNDADVPMIDQQFSVAKLIEVGNIIMEFNGLNGTATETTIKN